MNENVQNSINDFYKLKSKYENEIMKNKKKIMNNPTLSAKEKRIEFQKLKPKCINCKRPGGSIFSIKYYSKNDKKDEYRQLKAVCGIIADPCNLNINIELSKYELLPDTIKEIESIIDDTKGEIIDDKNKLLFGLYTTEAALQNFDELRDYVSEFTSLLQQYLDLYINIVDNSEKKAELREKIELSYSFILQIKECVHNYYNLQNSQYITDAVNIYITNLKPLLNMIMHIKYKENFVFYNEESNTFHLIQKPFSIESLEYSSNESTVITYDVGLTIGKKDQKSKTKKKDEKKQGFIIESSDTEGEDKDKEAIDQIEEISPSNEVKQIEPIINNGTVTWPDNKYQQIWDKFPTKLKTALSSDKEWATKFTSNCVNARENKQACVFVSPDNLLLPPLLLDNGNYDFDVEAYNTMFNKLDKSYQKTLLTLSSKNETTGITNYSMLEITLNNLLAKELDFNNKYF
jgi:hypothetical protein